MKIAEVGASIWKFVFDRPGIEAPDFVAINREIQEALDRESALFDEYLHLPDRPTLKTEGQYTSVGAMVELDLYNHEHWLEWRKKHVELLK